MSTYSPRNLSEILKNKCISDPINSKSINLSISKIIDHWTSDSVRIINIRIILKKTIFEAFQILYNYTHKKKNSNFKMVFFFCLHI